MSSRRSVGPIVWIPPWNEGSGTAEGDGLTLLEIETGSVVGWLGVPEAAEQPAPAIAVVMASTKPFRVTRRIISSMTPP